MTFLKFLLLSLGTHAFAAPTSGVVRVRGQELRAVTGADQRTKFELLRLPMLNLPSTPELHSAAISLNVALLTAQATGVEFDEAFKYVPVLSCCAFLGYTTIATANERRLKQLQEPEALVRAKLKARYDPPPSNPWTGNATWAQEVEAFVDKNELRKTLVLVDPSGTAKPDLLDPLFSDKIHVVAPAMTTLSLEEDLGKFFGFKDKGLDDLAGWIKDGITFPLGSALLPAKLIVKVPSRATTEDIVTILSDVNELKEKAGQNIITIVTITDGTVVGSLAQDLLSALQVLS